MDEKRLALRRRLEALLPFLDVASPDLCGRFEARLEEAETLEELEIIETELFRALAPR